MGFWDSKIEGEQITGNAEDSFLKEFENIPDGTTAPAMIKSFLLTSKKTNYDGVQKDEDLYEIVWKITSGEFKNREVTQKIKAFDDKPNTAQRALNMLKRIYDSLNHKPTHSNVPTDDDHKVLIGKILGIKIGEWIMPRKVIKDGQSPFSSGNNVIEVHKITNEFRAETGTKKLLPEVTTSHVNSAFSRNPRVEPELGDDCPF